MRLRFSCVLLAGALAAPLLATADAQACGGCFHPPTESTVVTGHRMALAVSPARTVLWDQIAYAGDPADFAWVLPVRPGAYIDVGSDAWFETLEAATTVQVQAPFIDCGGPGGCLFGSADMASSLSAEGAGGGVQVVHRGTVGPYDTVTLSTSTPGALNDWLTTNGYAVDEGTQPVIDAYVAEGFDFIALRLQPGQGVREMKPVKVVTPGSGPVLPLRMVAAGTGATVDIVLYVIGEGRWATQSFPTAAMPLDLLSWDFASNESNYPELRAATLAKTEGRGWLTAYAQHGALFGSIGGSSFFGLPQLFHETYAAQALSNGEIATECALPDVGGSSAKVVDPCPAGAPPDDPACTTVGAGEIDARTLRCGDVDDLAAALVGMHPADVWLTRLEASLPREALSTDLTLEAAARQEPVSNQLVARVSVNAEGYCGSATAILDPNDETPRKRGLGVLALGAFAAAAALARRLGRAASRRRPAHAISG